MTTDFMTSARNIALLAVLTPITTDTVRASEPVVDSKVNLAVVATPSSSYVSGDTSLRALNDDNNPRNQRHARSCHVGNIPRKLLMLPMRTSAKDSNRIYANLFFGSELPSPTMQD
jgi:hypothetical protein